MKRKFGHSFILTISAACVAAMGLGLMDAVAAEGTQQAPLQAAPQATPNIDRLTHEEFECYVKLDYTPNNVGGLYITNYSGELVKQGATVNWTLNAGGNTYPHTKKMTGMWNAGQTLLFQTFNWSDDATCTNVSVILAP